MRPLYIIGLIFAEFGAAKILARDCTDEGAIWRQRQKKLQLFFTNAVTKSMPPSPPSSHPNPNQRKKEREGGWSGEAVRNDSDLYPLLVGLSVGRSAEKEGNETPKTTTAPSALRESNF